MRKTGLFMAMLSLCLFASACGKNDVADIVDDVTVSVESTTQSQKNDDIIEDTATSEVDKDELFIVPIDTSTSSGFEGMWVLNELVSSDLDGLNMLIVDDKISMSTVGDILWCGNIEDIENTGNGTVINAKCDDGFELESDKKIAGDTLELLYSDGTLNFKTKDGVDVKLYLMSRKVATIDSDVDNFFCRLDSDTFSDTKSIGMEEKYEMSSGINVSTKITENNYVYSFITNNTNKDLSMITAYILCIDDSGNPVYPQGFDRTLISQNWRIHKGETIVMKHRKDAAYNNFYIYAEAVDSDDCPDVYLDRNSVKLESNIVGNELIVNVTNLADVKIKECEFTVVFYKDGKIVDIGTDINSEYNETLEQQDIANINWDYLQNLNVGDTEECKVTLSDVEYDNYEIYVNYVLGDK